MTKETFKGTVENYYGKTIASYGKKDSKGNLISSVAISGEYDAYSEYPEIPAKELPTNDDILKMVNAKEKAAAKAKATVAALDAIGITKPDPDSEEVQNDVMAKIIMKQKNVDRATADRIVASMAAMATAATASVGK